MNNEYHTLLPLLWFSWYSWVSIFVDFVKSTDFGYTLNRDCDLWLHIFIRLTTDAMNRLEKEVRENKYPTNIDETPVYMHVHKCTKHHNDKFLK